MNTTDSGLRELVGKWRDNVVGGGGSDLERCADELESILTAAGGAQEKKAVAWACTDYDGHVGVGLTKQEAKQRAGESCNEYFPLFADQPTAPAPAGMVLVTRELSGEAVDAGQMEIDMGNDFADAWQVAMEVLAAAPAAQVAMYERTNDGPVFRIDRAAAKAAELADVIVPVPDGAWLPADITPDPSGADETGSTTGLALYIEQPNDGGPNIRQGRYDHLIRTFIDSTTAMSIYPDLWSAPGDVTETFRAGELADTRAAAPAMVVDEVVAWQVNATLTHNGWETCTKREYEDTIHTGRYRGIPGATKDVQVRALSVAQSGDV